MKYYRLAAPGGNQGFYYYDVLPLGRLRLSYLNMQSFL